MAFSLSIVHHGVGKANSNGVLLLSKCAERALCIVNIDLYQANRYSMDAPSLKAVAQDKRSWLGRGISHMSGSPVQSTVVNAGQIKGWLGLSSNLALLPPTTGTQNCERHTQHGKTWAWLLLKPFSGDARLLMKTSELPLLWQKTAP